MKNNHSQCSKQFQGEIPLEIHYLLSKKIIKSSVINKVETTKINQFFFLPKETII